MPGIFGSVRRAEIFEDLKCSALRIESDYETEMSLQGLLWGNIECPSPFLKLQILFFEPIPKLIICVAGDISDGIRDDCLF